MALLAVGAPGVEAAESPKIWTYGDVSCGRWIADAGTVQRTFEKQWLLGFVSASSIWIVGALKKTDADSIVAYVDKYCRDKPLENLSNAAFMLSLDLKPAE